MAQVTGSEERALHGGDRAVREIMPPYPQFGLEEKAAVEQLMNTGRISSWSLEGPVKDIEAEVRSHYSTQYALSFSSGTAALHAALWAVGVRPGDYVLTPGYTWLSAITSIFQAGATPLFCDLEPDNVILNREELRRFQSLKPKAVIVTHMWGLVANMPLIMDESRQYGLRVIEDCSHAHGASLRGRKVGTFGDVGCFSMQNRKPVAAGEGGFAITNDHETLCRMMVPGHIGPRLAQELTSVGEEGRPDYVNELAQYSAAGPAYKYRISLLAAAIGAAQMRKLDQMNADREENYHTLRGAIDPRFSHALQWIEPLDGAARGWYAIPALLDIPAAGCDTQSFIEACQAEGVTFRESYPNWLETPFFSDPRLRSQFWGTPLKPDVSQDMAERPEESRLRQRIVLFDVPPVPMPGLMKQTGEAIGKVLCHFASTGGRRAKA